ncbi:HAMP domain-containing histidine kinase [Siccirubricoccus sp. KC 17139]|uniref:histidine kinase n=1 Tax=Siccirubricoccus soli TaxID=2899147 RepID=A0ABT1DAZ9_9PROT|nr:HAMP domain-containing sensor histidine kinase [Siccirubricoccus soli]MCO6418742.1 HAMP domain-containing histidine kinase [Siccirubricoccus soli]MCP2684877.1 HAMP domain-containing histidine kinase [Siccirubricoccus soli]
MRRPRSLTATGVVLLLLGTVGAATASLGMLLTRNSVFIAGTEVDSLAARAQALAAGLRRNEAGKWTLHLPRELAARFDATYRRSFYAIRDGSGRAILSSLDTVPDEVPVVLPNSELEEPATFQLRRGGMALQGVSTPVEVEGERLVVQVADNMNHPDVLTDDLAANFLGQVSWVILPAFLALAAVAFGTLRLCLRPIERLSERAAALPRLGAGARLEEATTPREIQPLVRAMNEALDQAERAHAAQRHFTAEAAHQMRTPLAVLKTHAELIQDARASRLLGADVAALERIVEQLLTLAEIDAAETVPDGPEVDLGLLAEAAVSFLEPLAARQEVELELAAAAAPVRVRGHEEPLYQAIINLLQNAIEHSPEGGLVRVTVVPPGSVEVADQGPGVPEQEKALVFRRFWRARADRAGRRRGAGLGLAIVQRVAELHRGSVTVADAPGGGALFRLSLEPAAGGAAAA